MRSFLDEVVTSILARFESLEDLVIVLPNKRAGIYILNSFSSRLNNTAFAPEIISIDTLMEQLAGLQYGSQTQLLLALYNTYSLVYREEKEAFHEFVKWGTTLLQDFNDIDRHLVDSDKIFSYLYSVQDINTWYLQPNRTELIEKYLKFWEAMGAMYSDYRKSLEEENIGYQGMVYRKAADKADSFINDSKNHYIFVGFNALTKAESKMMDEFFNAGKGTVFWDIDTHFLNDPLHDAGYYIRQYQNRWPDYSAPTQSDHFKEKKTIEIIGAPNNIAQAKYVGKLLEQLHAENPDLNATAVVLGDESLLNPLMNSIPKTIDEINITMGYPLEGTPAAGFFNQLFILYSGKYPRGWYYQDLLTLLTHPFVQQFQENSGADELREVIVSRNWSYLTLKSLKGLCREIGSELENLFPNYPASPLEFTTHCLSLIAMLKDRFSKQDDTLSLEFLYGFYQLFNQLKTAITEHPFLDEMLSVYRFYEELLRQQSVDFQGEPLRGLQLMGMLESRNIDFETVVITSVNEGVLPAGKNYNSFIPYDMKREFGLPSYKEKDGIYTYHFYRLLQRASRVYLLYNTEPDVLDGGEKSRFINQLLTDPVTAPFCTEKLVVPDSKPAVAGLQEIAKSPEVLEALKKRAVSGFSPTTLSLYVENPLEFYKKVVLSIRDAEEMEEDVDARTFGIIIHDVLEALYKPAIGKQLLPEMILNMKGQLQELVRVKFEENYPNGDYTNGKNLLAYKTIVQYTNTFLDLEIEDAGNNHIEIVDLEKRLELELDIPGLDYPVLLKGTIDRIDKYNGQLRVIDYKTGKVDEAGLKVYDWELLKSEPKFSKALQLLCYALLANAAYDAPVMECGIITFKSLSKGFVRFYKTPKPRAKKGLVSEVDDSVLEEFRLILTDLITEIFMPAIPIRETEVL